MTTCLKNNRAFIGGISSEPTDPNLEIGDIYYNTTDDTMYRYDQTGEWVPLGSGGNVTVSLTAPVDPSKDDGWFDTGSTGLLYIWDGHSWIQVLDPKDANTTHVSTSAPTQPVVGDLWVDVANLNTLKLYYNGAWVTISTPPALVGALTDLDDITNTASATVEQYLTSNGNNTSSFASEVTQLQDLPDVTNAPTTSGFNKDILVYNGTDYSFIIRVQRLAQLEDVDGNAVDLFTQVLKVDTNGGYKWVDNKHQLEFLSDVTGSTTIRHVLQSNGNGTYEFRTPKPPVHYSATEPSSPAAGRLWFDNSDTNNAGLYFYYGNTWVSTAGGVHPDIQPVGVGSVTHTVSSDDADYVAVNGQTTLQEVRTSDYISDGDTFEIPANWWIWSDNTSVAALIVDTPNATIVNNGYIIGRGGDGGNASTGYYGQAGGPAISVTASGVTITNNTGAYIAGGGGGGGSGMGGGGAGGGAGGGGTGGAISMPGSPTSAFSTTYYSGQYPSGRGGAAGGGGGHFDQDGSDRGSSPGGGGGRVLPPPSTGVTRVYAAGGGGYGAGTNGIGVIWGNGAGAGSPAGNGGSYGNAGNSALGMGSSQGYGPGGGGWGAAGGTFNLGGTTYNGGAGGAAVSGTYTQGTWQGTVYGSA